MPNRLYNKQVSPKGYKAGGRTGYAAGDVIKTDAGQKGMVVETGSPGTEGQYNKAAKARLKKIISNRKIMNNPKASGAAKKSAKKQNKFLTGGKGQNFLKPVKSYKMGGRIRKMGGGSLKPVNPKTQKGLSKLPTEVRNKMGYMKKGGKVHGK